MTESTAAQSSAFRISGSLRAWSVAIDVPPENFVDHRLWPPKADLRSSATTAAAYCNPTLVKRNLSSDNDHILGAVREAIFCNLIESLPVLA